MKLRYYLRGIGLGIIVATFICICASMRNNKTMSDAEIKAKASELGMIENTTLVKANDSEEDIKEALEETVSTPEPVTDEIEEEPAEEEEVIESSDELEVVEPEEIEEPVAEETVEEEEETVTPEPETVAPSGDIVTIIIDKGNGSDTVARKLADAGLVSNAAEYDKWLIENGYDRRISAGAHRIPKGASNSEIASIISSRAQ